MKNKHKYPENWTDTIRPEILKRDKYTCSDCGVIHRSTGYYVQNRFMPLIDEFQIKWAKDQGFKVSKIHLQIAHLDQDTSNNNYSNLLSKCPKCHLRFDNLFNSAKRLMRKPQNPTI